jgi:hypothetical protein
LLQVQSPFLLAPLQGFRFWACLTQGSSPDSARHFVVFARVVPQRILVWLVTLGWYMAPFQGFSEVGCALRIDSLGLFFFRGEPVGISDLKFKFKIGLYLE